METFGQVTTEAQEKVGITQTEVAGRLKRYSYRQAEAAFQAFSKALTSTKTIKAQR